MRFRALVAVGVLLTLVCCQSSTRADPTAESSIAPPSSWRVAAVQMRSSRVMSENLAAIDRHLANCAADSIRVAVFPECAATGYFDDEFMCAITAEQLELAERRISESCRRHTIHAIVGMPYRDRGKLYNSAVVFDTAGRIVERYHKLQLAESWPDAGDHLSVFSLDGIPCSIIICHDERYPELVRLPVLAGARMVFYLSHESELSNARKLAPYRAQIQARAVENGVFIIHANAPANENGSGSHGQSRIIAPDGNLIDEASFFGEEVIAATLDPSVAKGRLARLSVERGPLGDWWLEGVKRVRLVESPATAP